MEELLDRSLEQLRAVLYEPLSGETWGELCRVLEALDAAPKARAIALRYVEEQWAGWSAPIQTSQAGRSVRFGLMRYRDERTRASSFALCQKINRLQYEGYGVLWMKALSVWEMCDTRYNAEAREVMMEFRAQSRPETAEAFVWRFLEGVGSYVPESNNVYGYCDEPWMVVTRAQALAIFTQIQVQAAVDRQTFYPFHTASNPPVSLEQMRAWMFADELVRSERALFLTPREDYESEEEPIAFAVTDGCVSAVVWRE